MTAEIAVNAACFKNEDKVLPVKTPQTIFEARRFAAEAQVAQCEDCDLNCPIRKLSEHNFEEYWKGLNNY